MKTIIYASIIISSIIYSFSRCAQTLGNSTKGNQIAYHIQYETDSKGFEVLLIENVSNKLSKQKTVLSDRAKTLAADPISNSLVSEKYIQTMNTNS